MLFKKLFKRNKHSREYRDMIKKYVKNAKEIAKFVRPWDYGWSEEFLMNQLHFMHDYYTLQENVVSQEDCEWKEGVELTRLQMVDEIINAHDKVYYYDFKYREMIGMPENERHDYIEQRNAEYNALKHEFYKKLEMYLEQLWD